MTLKILISLFNPLATVAPLGTNFLKYVSVFRRVEFIHVKWSVIVLTTNPDRAAFYFQLKYS